MNVIARLEFELFYYDPSVQHFNHYTIRTPPKDLQELSRMTLTNIPHKPHPPVKKSNLFGIQVFEEASRLQIIKETNARSPCYHNDKNRIKYVNLSRVILCEEVWESGSLYDYIYIFCVVFSSEFSSKQLYDTNYSYLIQIICPLLSGVKYSYLIQIICT